MYILGQASPELGAETDPSLCWHTRPRHDQGNYLCVFNFYNYYTSLSKLIFIRLLLLKTWGTLSIQNVNLNLKNKTYYQGCILNLEFIFLPPSLLD